MQKVITIDGKDIKLSASLSWMYIYRHEFGKDPVGIFVPLLQKLLPLAMERSKDSFSVADLEELSEVLYDINILDFLNILWALAKNANELIRDAETWYRQFNSIELDKNIVDIFELIAGSFISSKKLEALKGVLKKTKAELI